MAFNFEEGELIEVKEEFIIAEDKVLTRDTAGHVKLVDGNLAEINSKSAKNFKTKSRICWCDTDTQVLLELWAERTTDLRRNKRNGHIYREMSVQMNNKFSPEEVHVKVRNLTQRYRDEKKVIRASGGCPSNWKFFNAVQQIIGSTATKSPEVLETFLFENTSDASCQPSPESQPLPSPVLPSSPPSPLFPLDTTSTSAAAAVSPSGKKRNHLGELVKIVKEQNVMLKSVVDDSQSLSYEIVNAIREQNETAKEFVTLVKSLIDKI